MKSSLSVQPSLQASTIPLLLALLLIAAVYTPIFPSMVAQWDSDPNYSHGFLVPLISAYFLWQNWAQVKKARVRPSILGLPVILGALTLLVVGYAGTEYFTQRSSFVFLLAGICIFWYGWAVFRQLSLPIGYLLFMVPLPYILYDALAFPLKLFVTKCSVWSLKAMGIIVWREGNIIMFPQTVLEVADACSGLRSLVSLLALAVAYAFFSQEGGVRRLLLVCSAIPIAIATNMLRVIVTGVLAQYYGAAAAEGFFHEFAGLAVFALAMVLLVLTGIVLRKLGR